MERLEGKLRPPVASWKEKARNWIYDIKLSRLLGRATDIAEAISANSNQRRKTFRPGLTLLVDGALADPVIELWEEGGYSTSEEITRTRIQILRDEGVTTILATEAISYEGCAPEIRSFSSAEPPENNTLGIDKVRQVLAFTQHNLPHTSS